MATTKKRQRIHRPVVWVVGASRGIGRELAKQFALIGCQVCLSGRNARDLEAAVDEINESGGHAIAASCNITEPRSILATVVRVENRLGPIDVLVNNAGITVFKSFLGTSLREFHGILATNLQGPILCMKAVLPSMVRRKRGTVINILSTAALKTFQGSAAYSASKAGMMALADVVREEVRPARVRVMNVYPGPTETPMWSPADRKRFRKRMMTSKSVAEAVLAAYRMPDDVVVEDLVLRPVEGDLGS